MRKKVAKEIVEALKSRAKERKKERGQSMGEKLIRALKDEDPDALEDSLKAFFDKHRGD